MRRVDSIHVLDEPAGVEREGRGPCLQRRTGRLCVRDERSTRRGAEACPDDPSILEPEADADDEARPSRRLPRGVGTGQVTRVNGAVDEL